MKRPSDREHTWTDPATGTVYTARYYKACDEWHLTSGQGKDIAAAHAFSFRTDYVGMTYPLLRWFLSLVDPNAPAVKPPTTTPNGGDMQGRNELQFNQAQMCVALTEWMREHLLRTDMQPVEVTKVESVNSHDGSFRIVVEPVDDNKPEG